MALNSDEDNKDETDENFSLQALYDLVSKMLLATEETKKTLQMECEEAKFALKPWPIETLIVKQLDKNICTCKEGLTSEERAEEIAAEIGKTLLHSQQLREKLASKLQRERQEARKLGPREIYAPRKAPPARRSSSQSRLAGSESRGPAKVRSVSSSRSREPGPTKNQRAPTGKSGPKNFVLANIRDVSRARTPDTSKTVYSKSHLDLRKIGNSGPMSSANSPTAEFTRNNDDDELETMNELDRLIRKFTVEATSDGLSLRENCPLHAPNAKSVVEERVLSHVDAVEGLDRLGLPPRLLKVLKTYHAYMRAELLLDERQPHAGKRQQAVHSFMENFKRINETSNPTELAGHRTLLTEYSNVYRESYNPALSNRDLKHLKLKLISLEPTYNNCNVKSTAGEMTFVRSNSNDTLNAFASDMRNWTSNGVWNYLCVANFKDIFGTYCTRYSDRNQLMQFFNFIQDNQKKVYEIELTEVLLTTVIPMLKKMFHPGSKEFLEIYKMIVAVVQIINIKVPVIADVSD